MTRISKIINLILVFLLVLSTLIPVGKVSALGPNLVANPSVENTDTTSSKPSSWQSNKWGTLTASFEYSTSGKTGNRSVKSTVTSYTSGDAKWYFNPVGVSANQTYTYSTYYKSNSTSEIVVQVKSTSGAITYHWLKTVPISTDWSQISSDFTMPATASTATVFHVINKVGFLQTDDTYFGLTNIVTPVAPTVSITNPVNNTSVTGVQNISASVSSSGASVVGVQFKINNTNLGSEDLTFPYEISWDTTTATNSQQSITATVRSSNGLSTTSNPIIVTVNNQISPPVDNENLIANPSVESVNTTNAQKPNYWQSNKWGTNATSFIYQQSGRTGNRSVSAQITSYTSGDAKWFFDPISVTPGKSYVFRDYYKSNVPTRVVAAFINSSGSYSYQELSQAPTATDWSQYQESFVIPASSTKITVFHLIDKVGTLTIDDVHMQVATPVVPSNDIVQNGSVENGTSTPTSWQKSSWGVNNPTFQYLTNEGHTGTKSIKVTMSNYQSGDAKWFFDPINTLTPGKQYRINFWYKTNVSPQIVALFTDANGTEKYFGLPSPKNTSSTTWQQYSDTFSVPVDAKYVSVFMLINQVGWVQTDDYSISEYQPTGLNKALLSLTFDDGHEDNYATALPLLNQYGFKSTQCYATTFIEDNQQAINNVLAFKNSGHEICSHTVTHPFLTTLNSTDLNYELQHSKQFLESVIGQPILNFASPYGDYNTQVNNVIDNYYQSHRTVDEGYNSKDNFDAYRLRVQNVLDTTSANQIKIWVEQAKADKTWLILVYHRVASDPGPYDTYTNVFAEHLATINTSGIIVKTYQDALTEIKSQL